MVLPWLAFYNKVHCQKVFSGRSLCESWLLAGIGLRRGIEMEMGYMGGYRGCSRGRGIHSEPRLEAEN